MTVSGPERDRAISLARLLLVCLFLTSCFEIPPELHDDDGALDVQPPIAVYDPNPFAAKNRWFQRAFRLFGPDDSGRPRSGTAEPLASAAELEIVDLAELTALSEAALEELARERGGGPMGCGEQLARFVFLSDVVALQAARGGHSGPGSPSRLDRDLVRALNRLAREFRRPDKPLKGIDLECLNPPIPIPMRAGGWKQVWNDLPGGLLPAAKDLRWTTVSRREAADGSRASALLRHRVVIDKEGGAELFTLPSECWILERTDEEVRPTVWRFDRAASLAGEDPWRRLTPDEEFSIRDPLVANGEWLTGNTASLCLGCHAVGRETLPVPLFPSSREAQSARVREIFRDAEFGVPNGQ